jgi:UDPglucose--hexose-1-phosphate uridylyltransferase
VKQPEIRKDYFRDNYVIIAPNRSKRPMGVHHAPEDSSSSCHFCPENFHDETITYQDDNSTGDWQVISVVNKFAALSMDNPHSRGQAEVIIETRRHGMDINDFSVEHIVRVLDAYIDRFMTMRNFDGIKHVVVFKNEGGKAGASLTHTHSQVMALPILPYKIESEARAFSKYRLQHITCPYCDIIASEKDKERVIWEDENVFVLSPYASDAPYGAWFLPKRHIRLIADLTHSEKESLATALKFVLSTLDQYGISYNYFVENAVNNEDYHMHIRLAPRPNIWAGLELGTGVIINPITPEFAAKFYRGRVKIAVDPKM